MGKSNLLRVQDVRDACRVIGECRDLGADPALWHQRMLEGLCRIIGTPLASGGEGWRRRHDHFQQISAFDSGTDRCFHEGLITYRRANVLGADPLFCALRCTPSPLTTRTRRQLVSDAVWYASIGYEYRRLMGTDHQLVSVYQVADTGGVSVIALQRAVGERDFTPREQTLLNFFHAELGRLIGRSLVSATEPSPEGLSPRLSQTLACLLEGDSEKQVAARLSLSRDTTHQYVTALYRHFGVQSRAQLLAYALKRAGVGWPKAMIAEIENRK